MLPNIEMNIYRMPSLPSGFNKLQDTTVSLIILRGVSTYGMKTTDVDDIVTHRTKWTPLDAAAKAPMTKCMATTTARNEYQVIYTSALTLVFDTFLVNNPNLSAADKKAMGIHEYKGNGKTPLPDPTTVPIVEISQGAPLQHIVKFRNPATNRGGKPHGVGFLEVSYKVGDPAPEELSDANLHENIQISGQTITYLLSQRGKMVYFFARWGTRRGKYGPWTVMFTAIIA